MLGDPYFYGPGPGGAAPIDLDAAVNPGWKISFRGIPFGACRFSGSRDGTTYHNPHLRATYQKYARGVASDQDLDWADINASATAGLTHFRNATTADAEDEFDLMGWGISTPGTTRQWTEIPWDYDAWYGAYPGKDYTVDTDALVYHSTGGFTTNLQFSYCSGYEYIGNVFGIGNPVLSCQMWQVQPFFGHYIIVNGRGAFDAVSAPYHIDIVGGDQTLITEDDGDGINPVTIPFPAESIMPSRSGGTVYDTMGQLNWILFGITWEDYQADYM